MLPSDAQQEVQKEQIDAFLQESDKQTKKRKSRAEKQRKEERASLESIEESKWIAISADSLSLRQKLYFPDVSGSHRHTFSSQEEFIWRVWGGWLEEHVLPSVNLSLAARRAAVAPGSRKRYNPLGKAHIMAYFLKQMLLSLEFHQKHKIPTAVRQEALAGLMGENRSEAIHGQCGLTDHILAEVIGTWPTYIKQFVLPGSLTCVDETIFPHYGKIAADEGKLQFIKDKPWDYGVVAYVGCQRAWWTGLPICLALRVNCLEARYTPTDLAVQLIQDIHPSGAPYPFGPCIVADSLWSQPASLTTFQQRKIEFLVAIKPDNTLLPSDLVSVASSDLFFRRSRTYSHDTFLLQVTKSSTSTTAVITDMWASLHASTDVHTRNVSYDTAVYLFSKEQQSTLVSLFRLTGEDAQLSKEKIIFKMTGWDPLRSPADQGSTEALTYEKAKALKKAQLVPIFKATFPRAKNTAISKQKMLEMLFPKAEGESAHISEDREDSSKRSRTRAQVDDLHGYREKIRGPATDEGEAHKLFARHYGGVDAMNKNYHMHFQLRNFQCVNSLILHSVVFYFFATCRSLWEEMAYVRMYAHARGAKSAWDKYTMDTLPKFIVAIAKAFPREQLDSAD